MTEAEWLACPRLSDKLWFLEGLISDRKLRLYTLAYNRFGRDIGLLRGRRQGYLPILADALEEAGCGDGDILSHCRGAGPHARGCWVVDSILGKQ